MSSNFELVTLINLSFWWDAGQSISGAHTLDVLGRGSLAPVVRIGRAKLTVFTTRERCWGHWGVSGTYSLHWRHPALAFTSYCYSRRLSKQQVSYPIVNCRPAHFVASTPVSFDSSSLSSQAAWSSQCARSLPLSPVYLSACFGRKCGCVWRRWSSSSHQSANCGEPTRLVNPSGYFRSKYTSPSQFSASPCTWSSNPRSSSTELCFWVLNLQKNTVMAKWWNSDFDPKKVEGHCKISKKLKRGALVFRRGEIRAENGKNLGGFTDIVCELRPKAPKCQISV